MTVNTIILLYSGLKNVQVIIFFTFCYLHDRETTKKDQSTQNNNHDQQSNKNNHQSDHQAKLKQEEGSNSASASSASSDHKTDKLRTWPGTDSKVKISAKATR